ncbi:putative ubiquitin thioesterase OTUB1 [Hamiltosporidium tvaerminnensis]|uniref:ubiquitinyl hydrolase 1 n=2 Tax=Hamiltosporidium TaxID=1176354 RepID=A0A4Q9LLE5_9MICR|nr:putative ubiquitin thioesterase OTUB1 [Hamiltosporidium magnivora]TBU10302.1 putative ubiquitin thioesterase OTUB1 [Hamiltosporidium tvaerminnensis]
MSEKPVSKLLKLSDHPVSENIKFKEVFEMILEKYEYYRESKKDGNCFYISFIYKLLEISKTISNDIFLNFMKSLEECNETIKSTGIDEISFIDFYERFIEILKDSRNNNFDFENIDQTDFNEIIAYFKILISSILRTNKEIYQPFMLDTTVDNYCKRHVEVFYVETSHIEIEALVKELPISIEIINIEGTKQFFIHRFGNNEFKISILFTPGHFEPIYEKK